MAMKPISWSLGEGPILPARAESSPRETQEVTEYEYQNSMATRARTNSKNPLSVPAARHPMDSYERNWTRQRFGSSASQGPRNKVRIEAAFIRL
jgi:hypothetical protein